MKYQAMSAIKLADDVRLSAASICGAARGTDNYFKEAEDRKVTSAALALAICAWEYSGWLMRTKQVTVASQDVHAAQLIAEAWSPSEVHWNEVMSWKGVSRLDRQVSL